MGPKRVIGIYHEGASGGRIAAIDKKTDRDWHVAAGDRAGARAGELVEAEQTGDARGHGLPRARIVARLGDPSAPRAVSLIAIHEHGIPDEFPEDALAEAEAAEPASLGKREDLRGLPLVTIDPSDARDHDDAVFAAPDDDPANPDGHVVWVAIADVAHYVRPGSALDREARRRGNSTYFPDRVVPMLPETLSGDLCSLHEGRGPALHRRADRARRRGPHARPSLHPRSDALGGDADLWPGPGRRRRHTPTPRPPRWSRPSSPRSGPHGAPPTAPATCASRSTSTCRSAASSSPTRARWSPWPSASASTRIG